jgi:hypothetical protein
VINRISQFPSFPGFRHSRCSRKALSRRFCPPASGCHDLALCLRPLKRVLTSPFDERLLRCWAGLGIHSAFGHLSAVPKSVISHHPGCPVGVWPRELGNEHRCGVRDIVRDVVYKVMMLLIAEFTALLLRNVNDYRQMVELRTQ